MALLRRYLSVPQLTEHAAGTVLRAAFAVAFMTQVVIATFVAILVRLLAAGVTTRPSAVLTWTLVGFAAAELVVAAVVSARLGLLKGRRAALTTALVIAAMYGMVSWFLALALATEQRGVGLYVLLLLLTIGYAFGFITVGRLAKAAAADVLPTAEEPATEPPPGA